MNLNKYFLIVFSFFVSLASFSQNEEFQKELDDMMSVARQYDSSAINKIQKIEQKKSKSGDKITIKCYGHLKHGIFDIQYVKKDQIERKPGGMKVERLKISDGKKVLVEEIAINDKTVYLKVVEYKDYKEIWPSKERIYSDGEYISIVEYDEEHFPKNKVLMREVINFKE